MSENEFPIESSSRVAAVLDCYPELEDVLIGMAPPFKKLKNPFLRKSVAKVATLRQAAAVGGIPVDELVNRLRSVVGQTPIGLEDTGGAATYFLSRPNWFDTSKVVASIDERKDGDEDKMPIITVLQRANRLQPEEILELITTFLPAPGIDIMKAKGFLFWSIQENPELVRTYFSKPVQECKDEG